MINSLVLTAYIRRFGYLLLPLSLSLALLGCDDQTSAVSPNNDTQISHDSSTNAKSENSTNKAQTNGEDASVTLAEDFDNNEGQSLIAAAKSDNPNSSIPARRTLTENDDSENNALQATLIGDYVGIYPCSFCSSISVTLNLFSDGSVAKTSIYHNPETPKLPHQESGVYRQDDVIITIAYDNKDIESYMIQNNHLVMMNEDDTLNADYTLSRK